MSPAKDGAAHSGKKVSGMSPEEKVVRAAYEKLTMLNKAAWAGKSLSDKTSQDDDQVLMFALSNFRIGPIQDVWGALHSKIKTDGSGEIIRLTRSVRRLNKGPEHVTYEAQWTTGQYASIYDRQWTIGDLLTHEPDKYYDVGEYALYDVTVSYQGKTRTYRALALFHNPYRSTAPLKPEFWDTVVGMGGALTELWYEKRPVAAAQNSKFLVVKGDTSAARQNSEPRLSSKRDGGGRVTASATETYSSTASSG